MKENSQHRHDISDKAWAVLSPILPGQPGQWGGIAKDNRKFINGVFWIYVLVLLGVTFLLNMASGVLFINVFVDGVTTGLGKKFSKL